MLSGRLQSMFLSLRMIADLLDVLIWVGCNTLGAKGHVGEDFPVQVYYGPVGKTNAIVQVCVRPEPHTVL